MKKISKIIIAVAFSLLLSSLSGCGNLKLRTHAGIDINWGSNGPKVKPHIGVEVYNGGRHH
jgi:hypothetical protein